MRKNREVKRFLLVSGVHVNEMTPNKGYKFLLSDDGEYIREINSDGEEVGRFSMRWISSIAWRLND